MTTKLINCKKANLIKLGYRDLEHWLEDHNHVYIGRCGWVPGMFSSKWRNPFSVKKYGRDGCLEKYREYILNNQELLNSLSELKDKTLACWCFPSPCHGDILIDLIK
jgi:hypothetical protein